MCPVHPTAVVASGASLAADVDVGPFCIVEDDVDVGPGTRLLAGTMLAAGTRVGARCMLGPYASLGGTPMDKDFGGEASELIVGDDVVIRDFASAHRATGKGHATTIESGALVMTNAHVTHNVTVGRRATIGASVVLAGHVEVHHDATLGSGVLVHQFVRIGAHAMIGQGSNLNRDILPSTLAMGSMARHDRLNGVGLTRHGIDGDRYKILERALHALRTSDETEFAALADAHADVGELRAFRANSVRGISAFRSAT